VIGKMKKIAAFAAFAACAPIANWMIGNIGICSAGPCKLPVGFGLYAPSGALMIGVALALRDYLHELGGWRLVVPAIAVSSSLSFATSPAALALASMFALALSEMLDAGVYAKLRARGRHVAVAVSGAFGAVADSLLFTVIAFGSLDLAAGNVLAKIYASCALALLWWRFRK
jgi:queuosine precursor transporter